MGWGEGTKNGCIQHLLAFGLVPSEQRVLNDLQRTKFSSPSYDLAPPQPSPPSPVSKLDQRLIGRLKKKDKCDGRGRGRMWGRSQKIRWRESLVLYDH